MTKREAIKQLNILEHQEYKNYYEYIDTIENFYMEHYHLVRNVDKFKNYISAFENVLGGMSKIAKIDKLVEVIKNDKNTPAHKFMISICLHRIYKELRKRYKNMSVENITILQRLGD